MGYTKDDELAINTIRLLAVSLGLRPSVYSPLNPAATCHAVDPPNVQKPIVELAKIMTRDSISRSMQHSRPIPGIPVRLWGWHLLPMSCSTNS